MRNIQADDAESAKQIREYQRYYKKSLIGNKLFDGRTNADMKISEDKVTIIPDYI